MWQFFKPVAIKSAKNLLRTGSETIKKNAMVNEVIKSTVQPTSGAVLGVMVYKRVSKLIAMRDKHEAALSLNPPIVLPGIVRAGLGRNRRRAPLYKKTTKRIKYFFYQQLIIYNFINGHHGR